jgi:hypothetical protein
LGSAVVAISSDPTVAALPEEERCDTHRESVSGWAGFRLGFVYRCAGEGCFCTVDLNLYGYFWRTAIAQRFGFANMKSNAHLNLQYKTRSKPPS